MLQLKCPTVALQQKAAMTTFDDILEEAGKFGRCQKRIFALFCFLSVPFAGVYVGIVFQGFTPDHWCRDPDVMDWRQTCGWSLAEGRRAMLPRVNSSGLVQPSSCEQYEVNWNSTKFTCDAEELDLGKSPTAACKGGWEYDYEGRQSFVTEVSGCPHGHRAPHRARSDAVSRPSLTWCVPTGGWWTCTRPRSTWASWLAASPSATWPTGEWMRLLARQDVRPRLHQADPDGVCASRFGRKMTFLVSNLLNGIAGILVALAPDYVSLLVFRTLYGFGVKGGWVVGYVLSKNPNGRAAFSFPVLLLTRLPPPPVTEIVGVEYRRTVGVLYQMFFSVGILFLPLQAYYITDWRWLQVVITVPYILMLSYYW